MTPKSELNRIIYSFNATAYEIMDYSLLNLKKFGMVPYNEFQKQIDYGELTFGQISGFFDGEYSRDQNNKKNILYPNKTTPINLVEIISKQIASQNTDTSDDESQRFQRTITNIKKIWAETYPKINFENQLIELDALLAEELNKGEEQDTDKVSSLRQQKNKIEILQEEVQKSGKYPYYTLIINGREIQLAENKIYNLQGIDLNGLTDIHLKYSGAILLNYICETSTIENPEEIEYGRATVSIWNQIAGMFTDDESILINYNYDANTGINILPGVEDIIPEYQVHSFENNNIGVYKTLNIMDIIKEKAIREIERTQNIVFTDVGVDEHNEEEWTDGQYYYTFSRITSISIEGEEGTPIWFQNYSKELDSDGRPKKGDWHLEYIGPTNKLVYKNIDGHLIYDIKLEDPQYLIIDFTADTSLTVKGQQSTSQEVSEYGTSKIFTR